MLRALALFVCVAVATADMNDIDCTGQPDGHVAGWGCRGFTTCENELPVDVDCHPMVYNHEYQKCDLPENTPPPCGLQRNCSSLADGSYADLEEDCQYFFTCQNGDFLGHNPCAPGLVFNEEAGICDWPFNTLPPCGTKEETEEEGEDIPVLL